jgi:hypothetical protein
MKITEVDVSAISPGDLKISWTIAQAAAPRSRYEYSILFSESSEGPFEMVGGPLVDLYEWIDRGRPRHRWAQGYYQVRAHDNLSGDEIVSDSARLEHKPDLEALQISRTFARNLAAGMGTPVHFLIKRTSGVACTACVDDLLGRSKSSDCNTCFRTGFEGGFLSPIAGHCDLNPSQKILRMTAIQALASNQTTAWTSGYPLLKPGDLVVEQKIDKRWRVEQVPQPFAKGGFIFRQNLILQEINPRDIEYKIEVS